MFQSNRRTMTREELLQLHDDMNAASRRIMEAKNQDYASQSSPFKNFQRHGLLGILVRMGDKLQRLENFVENGTLAVKDESVRDCLLDLQNYCVLFQGFIEDTKDSSGPERCA